VVAGAASGNFRRRLLIGGGAAYATLRRLGSMAGSIPAKVRNAT